MSDTKRRVDYPVSVANQARTYHAAGFGIAEICRLIEREHGRRPGRDTVTTWVDEDYRRRRTERMKRQGARVSAQRATFRLGSSTPEYKAAFVARLREESVTWENVARCCRVVFSEPFDTRKVQTLHQRHLDEEAAAA